MLARAYWHPFMEQFLQYGTRQDPTTSTLPNMIIPIRCFSCGKVRSCTDLHLSPITDPSSQVVADLYERYMELVAKDENNQQEVSDG